MNRYVYMGVRNWYRIPGWVIDVARRNNKKETYSVQSNYQMIHKMSQTIIGKGNVNVEVYGKENLPKEQGYVILSNHQGLFDGMALSFAMEQPFHFLAMKEMDEFPFVKYVMRMLRTIYMDREDIRQSLSAIKECAKAATSGENVLIFPEGTLEKENNILLPYKPGSLKAAYMAKASIVPVVLYNSFVPFGEKSCKKCTVKVKILEPYYYEDYKKYKTTELTNIIQKQSQNAIKKSSGV